MLDSIRLGLIPFFAFTVSNHSTVALWYTCHFWVLGNYRDWYCLWYVIEKCWLLPFIHACPWQLSVLYCNYSFLFASPPLTVLIPSLFYEKSFVKPQYSHSTETDLHNVIKKGNVLEDIHRRYIMYQLFRATRYLHSGSVIHRDLKVRKSTAYVIFLR